jgi:hypothetical protein
MKKGQAALEFLTTYGWAFLVILLMIGALAYFGVLNPKNFLPSRCTFGPELSCIEARIVSGANNNVSFRFSNGIGSTASFNFSMTYIGGTNPAGTCFNGSTQDIPPGITREVQCSFPSSTLPPGDKAKFDVTAMVKRGDGTYWVPVKGEIYGSVI